MSLTTHVRHIVALGPLSQDETDPAFRGRSLRVSWAAPAADDEYGDYFGDGGDDISEYLVEWSSASFEAYEPTTSEVFVSCDGGGTANGTFRLLLNTSETELAAVKVNIALSILAGQGSTRRCHEVYAFICLEARRLVIFWAFLLLGERVPVCPMGQGPCSP